MRDDEILELEDSIPEKIEKKKQKKSKQKKKAPPKSTLGRLWGNIFVRNFLYVIVGFCLLIFVAIYSLKIGTQHNKTFQVPDFIGMTLNEAIAEAQKNHLRIEVIDSVFAPQRPRGTVFKQNPETQMFVKKNRRILLTMNAVSPRQVKVPDVVGYSLRQAKAVLLSQGLQVGTIHYETDIATNMVLEQRYKGLSLAEGQQLIAGTEIDLVLGISDEGQRTIIPATIGLSAERAKDILTENSLNVSFHYDKGMKNYADSLAARIYRQTPSPSTSVIWPLGTKVDVYLKAVEEAVKEE